MHLVVAATAEDGGVVGCGIVLRRGGGEAHEDGKFPVLRGLSVSAGGRGFAAEALQEVAQRVAFVEQGDDFRFGLL